MSKKENMNFTEFVENIYLETAKARKRSWKIDERLFRKYIFPHFGESALKAVTANNIEDWLNRIRNRGLSPASCNRILAVMKSICHLAVKRGQIPVSPCRDIRDFRLYAVREKHLTPTQTGKLLALLEKSEKPEAMAIRLILLTGARKNEILKAKWENVNMEERALIAPMSKSGRPAFIILSDEAMKIISDMRNKKNSDWLFPAKRNPDKPMCDIYYYWNKIRTELGFYKVRIHDLRHTFASGLINSGHTLFETQRMLGHANPATTMRYAHLEKGAMRCAANNAAKYLLGEREEFSSCPGLVLPEENILDKTSLNLFYSSPREEIAEMLIRNIIRLCEFLLDSEAKSRIERASGRKCCFRI